MKRWVNLIDHAKQKSLFASYQEEANRRTKHFASGYFFNKRNVAVVCALVCVSVLTIVELVTPPKSIVEKINSEPGSYFQFRNGEISFGTDKHKKGIKIELPFREVAGLPGYDASAIHYVFIADVPANKFKPYTYGLMIPKIWGTSRVYLNGELRDFGNNIWPILAIESAHLEIDIFADMRNSGGRVPISATYPLIVAEKEKLQDLVNTIEEQLQASPRALAAYSLAIILFGMLFIAYPKKPELLAFVIFLGASLSNSLLISLMDQKKVRLLSDWNLQQVGILSLDLLVNLALLAFTLFFFRAHPKAVFSKLYVSLFSTLTIGSALTFFFTRAFNANDFSQVAHVVLNSLFLVFQLTHAAPRLAYICTHAGVPRARKIAGLVVFVSVVFVYLVNIIDYFTFLTALHTLYSNGLVLNLALSAVVAFEISRAEVNQVILGSMLPREVREGLQLNAKGVDQTGFILLVDAIGYSANRKRFDDIDERTRYIERLAAAMLKPVHDLKIENFSILNCTGDGLYCAIRGKATKESLNQVLTLARLIATTPDNDTIETIKFRAAIGYGEYGVRIIEHGNLRKEFVAGNVLNDLSRIIGTEASRLSIRILLNDGIRSLVDAQRSGSIIDKHGFEHEYYELLDEKKAA